MLVKYKYILIQSVLLLVFVVGVCKFYTDYRPVYYANNTKFYGLTMDSIATRELGDANEKRVNSSDEKVEQIIEQYGDIVKRDAKEIGMPASVKMAQLILESGKLGSDLARNANNCFGIKHKGGYSSEEMKLISGVYRTKTKEHVEKRGKNVIKVVEAEFISYHSIEASIKHHSLFLKRRINEGGSYTILKRYNSWDIEGWAYGLKSAGYATDVDYPERLIDVINKYNLKILDN